MGLMKKFKDKKKNSKFLGKGGFESLKKGADQQSFSKQLHKQIKKQRDVATGKEAGKDAAYEQKKQGEVVQRQQQVEQLRLAEATSDINKRKLLSRSGGRTNLMRSLG